MTNALELEDESLGVHATRVEVLDGESPPAPAAANPLDEEDLAFGVAMLVKTILSFVARRRHWEPPTEEEVADIAPPSARLVVYFFPWLKDMPILVDAVAAGSGLAGFYARREDEPAPRREPAVGGEGGTESGGRAEDRGPGPDLSRFSGPRA